MDPEEPPRGLGVAVGLQRGESSSSPSQVPKRSEQTKRAPRMTCANRENSGHRERAKRKKISMGADSPSTPPHDAALGTLRGDAFFSDVSGDGPWLPLCFGSEHHSTYGFSRRQVRKAGGDVETRNGCFGARLSATKNGCSSTRCFSACPASLVVRAGAAARM